jgi:hypothetical protein
MVILAGKTPATVQPIWADHANTRTMQPDNAPGTTGTGKRLTKLDSLEKYNQADQLTLSEYERYNDLLLQTIQLTPDTVRI